MYNNMKSMMKTVVDWAKTNVVLLIVLVFTAAVLTITLSSEGFAPVANKVYALFPKESLADMSFTSMFANNEPSRVPAVISPGEIGLVMEEDDVTPY
jgi:hypothetical protein